MDTPTPLLSIGDKSTKSSIDEPSPSKLYKALTHLSYRDPPAVSSTLSPSPTPSELADADADLSEKIVEELYPSTWKQYTILLTLNLAMFVDVVSGSALNVVLPHVAKDLGLAGGDISWILTSYAITFASFLLSAGRLADLTSAGWLFIGGIGMVAVMNVAISFLNNGILFLILRAVQGIAAACTIPSSYNITVRTFPEGKARNRAIAILGLVGSFSFSIGVIIGGLFEAVSWRWLFRMIAILSALATVAAIFVVPKNRIRKNITVKQIIAKMDLFGLLLSVGAVILIVLALTSGPEYGWNDPRFYVPLPVSLLLFVGFFLWEAKGRTEENAMLPAVIWETPTVKPLCVLVLCPFIFWGTSAYGFPTFWQEARGISSIDAAVRLLPVGIAAFVVSVTIQIWPSIIAWRRWVIFVNMFIVACMELLYVFSDGGAGQKFWNLLVPAYVIGSGLCQFTFLAINVFVITSVPAHRAGVVGALTSVLMQLGNVIGIAVQSACLERSHGPVLAWTNYARSYWALFGWIMISTVGSAIVSYFELKRGRRLGLVKDEPIKVDVVHMA